MRESLTGYGSNSAVRYSSETAGAVDVAATPGGLSVITSARSMRAARRSMRRTPSRFAEIVISESIARRRVRVSLLGGRVSMRFKAARRLGGVYPFPRPLAFTLPGETKNPGLFRSISGR